MDPFNVFEASINELQLALSSNSLTCVDLVAQYLRRISRYDCRGITLNSIPVLNRSVFDEAAASDDHRTSGKPVRRLEGIPYTVKDSYKVKGMTAASGSPAFKDLVATEDAFTVTTIRAEGGVLIGRTNMPPMAYGGMQRGIYGRSESPYNPDYLAAAFASGSSNGSAVSTAASLAAFGMGEETVSSGRSPASNNAVVAYTPSRGWISIRGNWPLYPTCDVVVPHTRTMDDMLLLLEVITAKDLSTEGDFWRDQPFVKLSEPWGGSSHPASFRRAANSTSLKGLRFAVPHMYIGGLPPKGATLVTTDHGVVRVWEEARKQLEGLGAEVVIVPDFPVVTMYENHYLLPEGACRLPENWNWTERGPLVAHGWDLFLRTNKDPKIPDLSCVDELNIYPDSMRTEVEMKHFPLSNSIHWGKLTGYLENTSIYETANLESAVHALENLRKLLLDDYLKRYECDCFIFPSQGDVGAADADKNASSAAHAWKNGVFYSNGNRALRHLGIPSVTVPMGVITEKQMPVGLTFAGRAYQDENLLAWANAFEKRTRSRTLPTHTPSLAVDNVKLNSSLGLVRPERPVLAVEKCTSTPDKTSGLTQVEIRGTIQISPGFDTDHKPVLQVTVDGEDLTSNQITISAIAQNYFRFEVWASTAKPAVKVESERTLVPVASDMTMVVVLARSAPHGFPAGFLGLV